MPASAAPPPPPPARVAAEVRTIPTVAAGRSVQGRALRLVRRGSRDAAVRILVVGQIHGDEPGGRRVVAALRATRTPEGSAIYTVANLNPDGAVRRTRQNARGVDLNRNFRASWRRGRPRSRYYPGPRPDSEPETRWAQTVVRAVRPHVSIWLHQPYGLVDSRAPRGHDGPAQVRPAGRPAAGSPAAVFRDRGPLAARDASRRTTRSSSNLERADPPRRTSAPTSAPCSRWRATQVAAPADTASLSLRPKR